MSRWMTGDQVLADFCEDLAGNPYRMRKLRKEAVFAERPEVAYDAETEQQLRFVHGQVSPCA